MYEHLFHSVSHGALGVTWHHLPALYMLDRHLMVMSVMGCTAMIILLVLMPVMKRRVATVLVVSACVMTGFLIGYSVYFPDWQVGYATLPPDTLSYHQWALPHCSVRIYTLVLGTHIGLLGANITLMATPYGETRPLPLRKTAKKGCFPELNPWKCPGASRMSLESPSTTANPLFWEVNQSVSVSPIARRTAAGRRLFSVEEEIKNLYSGKRLKPVHFARSASTDEGRNDSLQPPLEGSSGVVKLDNSSFVNGSKHKHEAKKKVVGACRPIDDKDLIPAFFDEWVDFDFGILSLGHIEKLSRGVPAPILTMSEYLSQRYAFGAGGGEGERYGGFDNWSHRVRYSGYYTSCVLYSALICWVFSLPIQMAQPERGAQLLGVSGLLMAAAAPLYACLVEPYPVDTIRISGLPLNLKWGACFYASLFGGLWTAVTGFGLAILRHSHKGAISTDLDLDELLQGRRIAGPSGGLSSVETTRFGIEFTRL